MVTGVYTICYSHAVVWKGAAPRPGGRHFCKRCGSALWVFDPRWPEFVHPFASAVDTALPIPSERIHIMLDSKAPWVEPAEGPNDRHFAEYPDESIAQWHDKRGLTVP